MSKIILIILLGGVVFLGGCYSKSAQRPDSNLITKPTTDLTFFKSKF